MSYLTQWVDPALEIKAEESAEKITQEELKRLLRLNAVAAAAGSIPRRVGSEASSEDLSVDKKRCRRIAHVTLQLASSWSDKDPSRLKDEQNVTQEAAVINWSTWWEGHKVWLINRRRYIATWSSRQPGQERWSKSAMVKLNNEMLWLGYALRD